MIVLSYVIFTKLVAGVCVAGILLVLLYIFVLMVLYAFKRVLR